MGDGHPENVPAAGRRVTGKPDRRAVCGPAAPQSRRRPVLGGLIDEYEWAA